MPARCSSPPPRALQFLGLLTALGALSGCQHAEETALSRSARTAWTPPAEAMAPPAEPAPRMTALDAVARGRPLDLAALTDIALENNPSTRIAWAAAKTAAAQRLQARSGLLPQVSVGFGAQRQQVGALPGLPAGFGGATRTDTYGPTYSIRQLIYDFGGTESTHAAAREALYAANFSHHQTLQDTVLAVQVNYYQTIAAQAALEAARAAFEEARGAHQLAQGRTQVGLAAQSDGLRAESNLRDAEFQVQQTTAAVEQNRAALSRTLGVQITAGLELAPPPPVAGTAIGEVQALTQAAISRRPDLQAAQATLRAREQSLRGSQAGNRPTLGVSLSGQESYTRGGRDNPASNWTLSLNLNWSIFDGYATAGRVAVARAQVQSAQESLRQQQIAVVSEVWTQFHALQTAVNQVGSATARVTAATEAFRQVEQGYRSGLNSLTDFLSAQNSLAQARLQKIQAETGLAINLARMAHATGSLEALPPANPSPR